MLKKFFNLQLSCGKGGVGSKVWRNDGEITRSQKKYEASRKTFFYDLFRPDGEWRRIQDPRFETLPRKSLRIAVSSVSIQNKWNSIPDFYLNGLCPGIGNLGF